MEQSNIIGYTCLLVSGCYSKLEFMKHISNNFRFLLGHLKVSNPVSV